jgi:hypothetical protein
MIGKSGAEWALRKNQRYSSSVDIFFSPLFRCRAPANPFFLLEKSGCKFWMLSFFNAAKVSRCSSNFDTANKNLQMNFYSYSCIISFHADRANSRNVPELALSRDIRRHRRRRAGNDTQTRRTAHAHACVAWRMPLHSCINWLQL